MNKLEDINIDELRIGVKDDETSIPLTLPVVALRDIIIFPHMVFPLLAGRLATQKAIEESILKDRMVMLLAQKKPADEEPKPEELYETGVVGRVLQILRLPTGLTKILLEGITRAKISRIFKGDEFFQAEIIPLEEIQKDSLKIKAVFRRTMSLFKEYIILNKNQPDELLFSLDDVMDAGRLADFVASHVPLSQEKRQEILEEIRLFERLMMIVGILNNEVEILKIEQSIDSQVREKISNSQRTYFLQEQMRIIRKELGEEADDDYSDIQEYIDKIRKAKMPREVNKKAKEELEKLKQMAILSPEATVIRNYLDWLVALPWKKKTKDNLNLKSAQKILDEDHFGLKKPKDRILEYLAVMKLSQKMRGQIICFVGPPGVGKTSLGKSIARALGRNFVRVSLGGTRDEAEIRGHRRTYIGSLPGRIIQQMKRAGTVNPVFLLDELDKMSTDIRGDPSSALLEVLDPEQNHAFSDHYLEVDYDLSQVLFITTANVRYTIPPALLDRMEVIELPGYLDYEKYKIATDFLIPKNLKEHGLEDKPIKFTENALYKIINDYTREAGVRELERCIAKICRRLAKEFVLHGEHEVTVKVNALEKYLGAPRYIEKDISDESRIGAANALAWTEFGGDILRIEVALMKGKGTLSLTGQLGDIMKESAKAALSYIRSIAEKFSLEENDFLRREVHIHIPEGAVPKDGPSAGIALTLAMLSAFTGKPIPAAYGFTGEITLRGEILPIGGLPEKLMAANRLGLKQIFIPLKNMKDLKEVPQPVLKPLNIITVSNFEDIVKEIW